MIFFIGYTASGKSTIAKRLANYLDVPFIDLDLEIVKTLQTDIANFFNTQGEVAFRLIEQSLLISSIKKAPKNAIIACGGGTPCFYDNLNLMKSIGLVVYLETPLYKILQHLNQNNLLDRPTIANNDLIQSSKLEAHFQLRLPFYLQAHVKTSLKLAKNPELLTMSLILFTNRDPVLRKLHILF